MNTGLKRHSYAKYYLTKIVKYKVDICDMMIEEGNPKTAIFLLTGYLGSGKTTLISYILKS